MAYIFFYKTYHWKARKAKRTIAFRVSFLHISLNGVYGVVMSFYFFIINHMKWGVIHDLLSSCHTFFDWRIELYCLFCMDFILQDQKKRTSAKLSVWLILFLTLCIAGLIWVSEACTNSFFVTLHFIFLMGTIFSSLSFLFFIPSYVIKVERDKNALKPFLIGFLSLLSSIAIALFLHKVHFKDFWLEHKRPNAHTKQIARKAASMQPFGLF